MKVVRITNVKPAKGGAPLFTGDVTLQSPFADVDAADLSITYVHFSKGVRNKSHTHSNDQVLIVTKGKGIVATKGKEERVSEGDIIWVQAGETHWHGADKDGDFTHISVTRSQTKLQQVEK